MSRRSRILSYGAAGVLVVAGALCAALVGGVAGTVLTIVLLSLGLGGAVVLFFLEVGLSEDQDRAREQERQARARRRLDPSKSRRLLPRRPRRPR